MLGYKNRTGLDRPRVRTWVRWPDWVNLVLGIWLFISPWVLAVDRPDSGGTGNFWWVGAAIFFVSLWALAVPRPFVAECINLLLAIWLFISPWVLRFSQVPRAAWDAWIIGVVVFFLAWWSLSMIRGPRAGGMSSSLPPSPPGQPPI